MRTVSRLLAGAAAAVAVLALGACTSGGSTGQGTTNFPVGDQNITMLAPDKRPALGPLHGPTVDGGTADLVDYRGHVVVLNVWGSWCPPCQAEAPALEAAAQALAPKGVKFLGINVRESGTAGAKAFQRTYGISYPSLFDQNNDYLLALRGVVAPNAIPSTIVVDAQGRVGARFSGEITKTTLIDIVDDVIGGKAAAS
jgi:thiol-disulfide isomerase/thioredoxin